MFEVKRQYATPIGPLIYAGTDGARHAFLHPQFPGRLYGEPRPDGVKVGEYFIRPDDIIELEK